LLAGKLKLFLMHFLLLKTLTLQKIHSQLKHHIYHQQGIYLTTFQLSVH